MPLIKPRTRGKQLVKTSHTTRLPKNEALYAYRSSSASRPRSVNQVIEPCSLATRVREVAETHQRL